MIYQQEGKEIVIGKKYALVSLTKCHRRFCIRLAGAAYHPIYIDTKALPEFRSALQTLQERLDEEEEDDDSGDSFGQHRP